MSQKEEKEEKGASASDMKKQLRIKPIKNNSKDKIEQPKLSESNIIPRINTSNLFIGSTGMGKSTLVTNLLTKEQFLGGKRKNGESYFDAKILVSPTGDTDDVQKELGLADDEIETDLSEVPLLLKELMKEQKKRIKAEGADKAPKILIIYDDVISHPQFMKNKYFIKSFIANRHSNFTVFLCSQSWTKIPRAIRLQARGVFYFAGSLSEVDLLCDEYCPPGLARYDFRNIIDYCTRDPYSFLYINKSVPMKNRFRKNLAEIIQPEFFKDSKHNANFSMPKLEENGGNSDEEDVSDKPSGEKHSADSQLDNYKTPDFNKRQRTLVTRAQHGVPNAKNGRDRVFGGGSLETRAATYSRSSKEKQRFRNNFGSRRLESGYHT